MPDVPSILIRGGRLLDPSQKLDRPGELLIENGRITAIDRPGKIPAERASRVLDAKGCWVLPGLIDAHVHLREPGLEYKETIETGTRAAVAGGFTSVACMANTQPVNDSPYVTAFIRERARATGVCRVFPIGAVSKGLKGEELAEIGGMVAEGARAISDDGMPVMNALLMRRAMEYAKAFGVPVISHAEDCHLVAGGVMDECARQVQLGLRGNPGAAEEIMVAREISLCRLTGSPLHIAHISTRLAIEHLRRARDEGLPVTAEASPHHLTLTHDCLAGYDTNFKMAPPLRSEKDVQALQKAVAEGLVGLIATDHAPHGRTDKELEFDCAANGILGLQTAVPVTLALVRKGVIPLKRWIESLTTGPARLLGIEHGTLGRGREADVTVIDPDRRWVFTAESILSRSRNSPFIGHRLQGQIRATIVGGRVAYEAAENTKSARPAKRRHR